MHNLNRQQQQQHCIIQQQQQQQSQNISLSPEQQQHIIHQMNQQNEHFATTSALSSHAVLKIENEGVRNIFFNQKFNLLLNK